MVPEAIGHTVPKALDPEALGHTVPEALEGPCDHTQIKSPELKPPFENLRDRFQRNTVPQAQTSEARGPSPQVSFITSKATDGTPLRLPQVEGFQPRKPPI